MIPERHQNLTGADLVVVSAVGRRHNPQAVEQAATAEDVASEGAEEGCLPGVLVHFSRSASDNSRSTLDQAALAAGGGGGGGRRPCHWGGAGPAATCWVFDAAIGRQLCVRVEVLAVVVPAHQPGLALAVGVAVS